MADRYDSFRALAQKLIRKNADGQVLKITEIPEADASDTAEPWNGVDEPEREDVATAIPFVAFNYMASETALQSALTAGATVGKLMVADAKQLLYVAASELENRPEVGQRLESGADKWSLIELEVVGPGAVDILYVMYVGD